MASSEIYIFNGKKVQIEDSRRTGEDINYVYVDEKGIRGSISCSLTEFEEYFIPTTEPFRVVKVKDIRDGMLYDVVYMIGTRVIETIKPNLTKDKAFAFKQWAVKNAVPGGRLAKYRASCIKVKKSLDNKKAR